MFTSFCLAVIYFVGISVAVPTTPAPVCICTMDYTPVCGVDGITYGNDCGRKCAGVQLAYTGECRSTCICPKIYKPVCGQDGKTYSNHCMLNCAGVAFFQEGACASVTQAAPIVLEENTCICTFIYQPVCGVDGVTYGNDCNRKCVNVGLAYTGMCSATTTAATTKAPAA